MEHGCKLGFQDGGNLVKPTWEENLYLMRHAQPAFAKLLHVVLASGRSDLIKSRISFVSCHQSRAASEYQTVSSHANICVLLQANWVRVVILVLPLSCAIEEWQVANQQLGGILHSLVCLLAARKSCFLSTTVFATTHCKN